MEGIKTAWTYRWIATRNIQSDEESHDRPDSSSPEFSFGAYLSFFRKNNFISRFIEYCGYQFKTVEMDLNASPVMGLNGFFMLILWWSKVFSWIRYVLLCILRVTPSAILQELKIIRKIHNMFSVPWWMVNYRKRF